MSSDDKQLWQQLDKSMHDPNRAAQAADRLYNAVKGSPGKEKEASLALRCLAIAQIHSGRYQQAESTLHKIKQEAGGDDGAIAAEMAYCLYRRGQFAEARQLAASPAATQGAAQLAKHVLSQSLFNLEDYATAATMYEQELATGDAAGALSDEDHLELVLNCSAARVLNGDSQKALDTTRQSRVSSHDLLYNAACALLEQRKYDEAVDLLDKGIQQCAADCGVTVAEAEEAARQLQAATEKKAESGGKVAEEAQPVVLNENIKHYFSEVAQIKVQRAYVLALQGNEAKALELLEEVFHYAQGKGSSATLAVGGANWAALKRTSDFFDTFRKLKSALQPAVQSKLTSRQVRTIEYNTALVLLHMGKIGECRSIINSLCRDSPDSDLGPMAMAALLVLKSKKVQSAVDCLMTFVNQHASEGSGGQAKLTVAQMWLTHGNLEVAVQHLAEVDSLRHKPAVVATVSDAYNRVNKPEEAAKVVLAAITHWEREAKSNTAAKDVYTRMLHFGGKFFLRQGDAKTAEKLFEQLVQLETKEKRKGGIKAATAGLVCARVENDEAKATAMLKKELPSVVDANRVASISIEDLESVPLPRATLEDRGFKRPADDVELDARARKKRGEEKKRRGRKPPEGATGAVDPERWLPMSRRSYIKDLPLSRQRQLKAIRCEEEKMRKRKAEQRRKAAEEAS